MTRLISAVLSCLLLLRLAGLPDEALGQDVVQLDQGLLGTYLKLKQLPTTASVLHVVAHPDDEDGAMLAYCARGLGMRTMLFSITRGEGGANLISSHFFDQLGALRTLEHMKAAGYYGNELFYSRAADYGYSKTLTEAMKQWQNGLPILEDLVEVIRRERPTILLSRFRGDPRDGHGHHQMAGVLSRAAFEAAADPLKFPQQLQRGLEPWQVKKLYVRAGSPWRQPEDSEWTIALPTGDYDPVIGRSYSQLARFGLGFQRSQGISGHDGDPGPTRSYYQLVSHVGHAHSSVKESSLLDGVDASWAGWVPDSASAVLANTRQQLENIEQSIRELSDSDLLDRKALVEGLAHQLRLLLKLDVLQEQNRTLAPAGLIAVLSRKRVELEQAISAAVGIRLDGWATDVSGNDLNHATPGEELDVHVRLAHQGVEFKLEPVSAHVDVLGEAHSLDFGDEQLQPGSVTLLTARVSAPNVPTKPYWRRDSIAQPLYQRTEIGTQAPQPAFPVWVELELGISDVPVRLRRLVHVRQRHPDYGQVKYPLTIVPKMSARFLLENSIAPKDSGASDVSLVVRSGVKGAARAEVRLLVPEDWTCEPSSHRVEFSREDEEATLDFRLAFPPSTSAKAYEIRAEVEHDGVRYREGFELVSAADVGRMNVFRAASHRIQVADVKLTGTPSVAYIKGSGDKVAQALEPLGVVPQMLSDSDLAGGDLSGFDVILVGVRAYAVREDIRTHNARLLDYVRRGGVLIVQYQTPEFDQNFGPYPYQMGRRPEEVSEEDAVVTVLQPDHPIFNIPNRISSEDFAGWFEQRGSKFWRSWDDQYTPLLECHDTGQAPQKGGMLVAKYGEGVYVYSAYAWYRQLPQGIAGAYRLFANMLSLPETK